jgi:hypothetical protein
MSVDYPARPRCLVAIDDELGPVRFCRRCDDWWPMDREFWVIQVRPAGTPNTSRGHRYVLRHDVIGYACRACRREQQAAHWRAGRVAA